jgi:hypothetical protein
MADVPTGRRQRLVAALGFPCGGRFQLIARNAEAGGAKRILDRLGLGAQGPPLARVQAPHDLPDPGPSHDGADVVVQVTVPASAR